MRGPAGSLTIGFGPVAEGLGMWGLGAEDEMLGRAAEDGLIRWRGMTKRGGAQSACSAELQCLVVGAAEWRNEAGGSGLGIGGLLAEW